MRAEYLLFNLGIWLLSFLGVRFFKKGRWPKLGKALGAILLVGLFYVIWDQWVTGWWWSFNEKYILGWRVGKLPLEEILFFGVVPWSCLLIWENLLPVERLKGWQLRDGWVWFLLMVLAGLGIVFWGRWYTVAVSWLTVFFGLAYLKWESQKKRKFGLMMLIVMGLILIFNGYLTARPVVVYNEEIMTSVRLGTVPIEDVLYGVNLVGLVVLIYERQKQSKSELADQ